MIDHSLPKLTFIRGSIFALRAVTPLSIFYCAFSIADPPTSSLGRVLLSWCILETGFWLLVYFPRKRALQSPAQHPAPLTRPERQELFQKCAEHIPNPEYYLSRWFLGARSQAIRRDNVKQFFRWALLNKGDAEQKTEPEEEEELEGYADGVETLLGRPLEPGRGTAQGLRLTVDEVKMAHRPFIWYMIVGVVDTLTATYLHYNGFILHRNPLRRWPYTFPWRLCSLFTRRISPAPNLTYWHRPHTSKTRRPILFIHGIGIGLYPYAQFLTEINKHDPLGPDDGQIGIIALELMPISFRITGEIPTKEELCRQISMILDAHGWDKVVLASHSYGSVVTTHLLHNPTTSSKIGSMILIDPVTFLLHLPDVAYNFTARKPRGANEHQLYYFASTDMMVAQTLARHFFWSENILWKEDVKARGRDVTVSLGGRDLIVDTETVGKYLAGVDLKSEDGTWKDANFVDNGVQMLWWPTCDHAQVFERAEGRRALGERARAYAAQAEEASEDLP